MSRKDFWESQPVMVACLVIIVFGSFFIGWTLKSTRTSSDAYLEFPYRVANMVAKNHEYNITSYNCQQYSDDFVNALKSAGFESSLVGGYLGNVPSNTGHMWTCLMIEPQSGRPILTNENYQVQYFIYNHKYYFESNQNE